MRALLFCLAGLMAASVDIALAQTKLQSKTDPNATEVRYFTAIDGLMDGNADVVLKETRQGKTVTPSRRTPIARTALSSTSPSMVRP